MFCKELDVHNLTRHSGHAAKKGIFLTTGFAQNSTFSTTTVFVLVFDGDERSMEMSVRGPSLGFMRTNPIASSNLVSVGFGPGRLRVAVVRSEAFVEKWVVLWRALLSRPDQSETILERKFAIEFMGSGNRNLDTNTHRKRGQ